MPITGLLTTAGTIHLCNNYSPNHTVADEFDHEEVMGVVLEMDEVNTREVCGKFLGKRVAIWSADELGDLRGTSAMEPTPENMQHLAARLAAAEDHLAREVSSNQAAALVRADLEQKVLEMDKVFASEVAHTRKVRADLERDMGILRAANASMHAEVERMKTKHAEAVDCLAGRLETIMEVRAEVQRLAADNDRLAAERDALVRQRDSLLSHVRDFEQASKDLSVALHATGDEPLTDQAERIYSYAQALEARLAEVRIECDRLAAELAEALSEKRRLELYYGGVET